MLQKRSHTNHTSSENMYDFVRKISICRLNLHNIWDLLIPGILQNFHISSWLLLYQMNHRFPFNRPLQKSIFPTFSVVLCKFTCFHLPIIFIPSETSKAVAFFYLYVTETYLAHLLSPFVRMNSIHHLWMIFMDYVLQTWLGRSKPFCRFLFAFFYFCLHSSTTKMKERSGPLAFSPPALSGSSKHLLIILLHSGSTTRVLSVCVWPGEKNNLPSGYLLPDLTNQFQWRDS